MITYFDICNLVLLLLACGVAIRNAVRSRLSIRLFWAFLAAAFGLWALVPGAWLASAALHGKMPEFFFDNPPLFLHVVFMIAAVASRPHLRSPSRRPYRTTLNFLVLLFFSVFAYAFYLIPYQYGSHGAVTILRFEDIFFVENVLLLAVLGGLILRSQSAWKSIYLHLFGASAIYAICSLAFSVADWGMRDPSGVRSGANYPLIRNLTVVMFTASIVWFLWICLEGNRQMAKLAEAVSVDTANYKYVSVLAMLAALAIPVVGVWELFRRGEPIQIHDMRLLAVMVAGLILASGAFTENYLTSREYSFDVAEAHDRLRLAMESGKSMGWDWNPATGENIWFGDLRTTLGISAETYFARENDFTERLHPDDRERVAKTFADATRNRSDYREEYRVVRTDGTIRWLADSGKFHSPSKSDPPRALGVAVDITERKQAEFALRESEERFRLMSNSAPVLIWMSGTDKLRTYFNKSWLDFTGRPLSAELGNGWMEGVHPEDLPRCLEIYTRAFDRRESFRMEYRLRASDGEFHWILDMGVPRFRLDGIFAGYIGSCVDITERKLAEEALYSIGSRLIEAQEEERARIARELHDDFSQRMALLAIELDRLRRDIPDSNGDALDRMDLIRKHASEIGSDIQALSHQLHSAKLDYLGIAVAMKDFCHEFGEKQKLKIDFRSQNLPSPVSPEVALCLYRVLQESLHNAAKHSQVSHFDVQLRGVPGEIQLTIKDAGLGFDVESVSKERGIGLISMRERVKLVNGAFSIASRLNHGTEISVRIPVSNTQVN